MAAPVEPIRAAGVVCLRESPIHGTEVLVIHRNRRDDWSLPKGKLDPGEHVAAAALREAVEETGYEVVLGPPLRRLRYPVADQEKVVDYWVARVVGRRPWSPNIEVDRVRWVPVRAVADLLTYPRDLELVQDAARLPRGTVPFVLLRHGQAEKRQDYADRHHGKPPHDGERPLTRVGEAQSVDLVPVLAAFGVVRIHSSDSVRCMTTVEPYAEARGSDVMTEPGLSEAGYDDHPRRALRRLDELLATPDPLVLCTHRPLLPAIARRIQKSTKARGVPKALAPGGFVVLHRTFDTDGDGVRVVAVEPHEP